MRLLLLGANGQLGHALRGALARVGELVCATRSGVLGEGQTCERADFDDPAMLPALVARIAPDVVVNAAAYTDVDAAESDSVAAFRANAEAPAVLARVCAARDALLVHYSSDYVFDGHATRPYREDDPTAPLNVYGASKRAGEEAIADSGARHMILRTAWVYSTHGRNFLLTVLRLAMTRDVLRIVADQTGTPTSATLIAAVTAAVLRQPCRQSGIWHLTAAGQTNWHGFASAIVMQAHARGLLAHPPVVEPITAAEFPAAARRPAYSCLETVRLQRDFGIELPPWETGLATVMSELR